MGKSRMMGAGHASASLYKCSPNSPTGGGNKKQGITSRVGLDNWENREIQIHSNGIGRFKLHFMNQLGGVEPGHSMFGGRWNRSDGLLKQFEQKQLEEEIKQDSDNVVIVPRQSYIVRSTRCPYGMYYSDSGAVCICPAGMYSTGFQCVSCPPGTQSKVGSTKCEYLL